MMADARTITPSLELILVGRNLERVADLATNIGEDAVFLAEGKQIKHHLDDPAAPARPSGGSRDRPRERAEERRDTTEWRRRHSPERRGAGAGLTGGRGTDGSAVRVAAIDIGSNSIRQIVADVSPNGSIRVVDELKAQPRLGTGV